MRATFVAVIVAGLAIVSILRWPTNKAERAEYFGEWILKPLVEDGLFWNKSRGFRLNSTYCLDEGCAAPVVVSISCIYISGVDHKFSFQAELPPSYGAALPPERIVKAEADIGTVSNAVHYIGPAMVKLQAFDDYVRMTLDEISLIAPTLRKGQRDGYILVASSYHLLRFRIALDGLKEGLSMLRAKCDPSWSGLEDAAAD